VPRYRFEAQDANGRKLAGHVDAVSPTAVAAQLSATGAIPLRIDDDDESRSGDRSHSGDRVYDWFKPRIKLDEVIVFSHQMASLTKAGISVVRAIRGLAESTRNVRVRDVLTALAADLEGGSDIATSMGRHPDAFSDLYVAVIHVGENTGRLDEAFKRIAQYLELERETVKRVKSATRYPGFVMIAIAIAIVILNLFVIPAFAQVFEKFQAELPWQTRAILGISDFFVAYWMYLLAAIGVGVWLIRRWLETEEGRLKWDERKLKVPIVGGIFERIHIARFCETFAMVMRAGLPVTQGLHVVSNAIGNEFMAQRVAAMRAGIERGESITSTAVASGLFTPVVLQMIAVGEETGSVDELLSQAARFYEEEVDYELKSLTDALEPVLIIAIGIMVLVLALGVFLPLWDLSGVANRR